MPAIILNELKHLHIKTMVPSLAVVYVACMCVLVVADGAATPYANCPMKTEPETRQLFIATCDTRSAWKEFQAMKIWNVTGTYLRDRGIHMKNVCKGENWGKFGFLTKPLIYLDYIKTLLKLPNAHLNHIILMDSDTFWSAQTPQQMWNKYDCARDGKNVVISTEMSCWVGRYCQKPDLDRWYSSLANVPSYSPFVNSGVVMGQLSSVAKMLDYVIVNNQSYFTTYVKHKFDDQYAIADYGINVAPNEVALDYRQQISASASIHAPGDPPDEGWPFVCRNKHDAYDMSCHIYTNLVRKQGHFRVNPDTCLVERHTTPGMVLSKELQTLAPDPLIWHGNGAGKQVYLAFGYQSFKCLLHKKNMTEADHLQTYG